MRRLGERFRQTFLYETRSEWLRWMLCVLLLVVLAAERFPVTLVIAIPLAAYLGLRLIASSIESPGGIADVRNPKPHIQAIVAPSLSAAVVIESRAGTLEDEQQGMHFRSFTSHINRCVSVITDEEYEDHAVRFNALVHTTSELIESYIKVVNRDMDNGEIRARLMENLGTIERAYETFWSRLNRDAVIELATLNEVIEFEFEVIRP